MEDEKKEPDTWEDNISFVIEGVLLFLVAILGLIGNLTSFVILIRQKVQKTFHDLLFLLSTFDTIYLISAVILFTLPHFKTTFSHIFYQHSMPYVLPVAHIGMVGSMFTTVAISLERYLAVVHPFAKFRHKYSSRHFIIPVVLYSLLYNTPKFFELSTVCPQKILTKNQTDFNTTLTVTGCSYQEKQAAPNDLRINYWYINVYCLWLNTILNILLPIVSLIILNIIILRKIKAHFANLDQNFHMGTFQFNVGLRKEMLIRKREVLISKIGIYIVIVIVVCHSIRLIPTLWEICQTFLVGRNSEQFPWPLWVDTVAVVSHLALALSCSLSFYIYCALYWTKQSSARMLSSVRERRSGPGLNSTNEINITVI